MNIRSAVIAMIALMLSAGPLMAMDSEYLEKRRKSLYEDSAGPVSQDEGFGGRSVERDISQSGREQPRGASNEKGVTQDHLRYWWL